MNHRKDPKGALRSESCHWRKAMCLLLWGSLLASGRGRGECGSGWESGWGIGAGVGILDTNCRDRRHDGLHSLSLLRNIKVRVGAADWEFTMNFTSNVNFLFPWKQFNTKTKDGFTVNTKVPSLKDQGKEYDGFTITITGDKYVCFLSVGVQGGRCQKLCRRLVLPEEVWHSGLLLSPEMEIIKVQCITRTSFFEACFEEDFYQLSEKKMRDWETEGCYLNFKYSFNSLWEYKYVLLKI